MRFLCLPVAACVAVCAFGCGSSAEDSILETHASTMEFRGQPDDRFAATWKSEDGVSTYRLGKDGSYELESKISTRGSGAINSNLKGEWRLDGDRLLFKDGNGNVVPYAYKLEGDVLELSLTGSLKRKTVLKRQ